MNKKLRLIDVPLAFFLGSLVATVMCASAMHAQLGVLGAVVTFQKLWSIMAPETLLLAIVISVVLSIVTAARRGGERQPQ